MSNKLTKFQQAEQEARATEKALEAEMKKRLRGAAEARRRVQEQKWQAAGELLEQAGLLPYLQNGELGTVQRGLALVALIEAAGLGAVPLEDLRELLGAVTTSEDTATSAEDPTSGLPWERR